MNYIKFSHDYEKLRHRLFTTIRRYDRYPSEKILVKTPSSKFMATIVHKYQASLNELPTSFLCYDTDTPTRQAAINILNLFYRNPILPDERLSIILLLREADS